jgi:hypothetical protein
VLLPISMWAAMHHVSRATLIVAVAMVFSLAGASGAALYGASGRSSAVAGGQPFEYVAGGRRRRALRQAPPQAVRAAAPEHSSLGAPRPAVQQLPAQTAVRGNRPLAIPSPVAAGSWWHERDRRQRLWKCRLRHRDRTLIDGGQQAEGGRAAPRAARSGCSMDRAMCDRSPQARRCSTSDETTARSPSTNAPAP